MTAPPISTSIYSWRKAQHGKDEALRYFTSFVETYPVAPIGDDRTEEIERSVTRLSELVDATHSAEDAMFDWLRHRLGIENPKGRLLSPVSLNTDEFIAVCTGSVPKRQVPTGAEIGELKREYGNTIEPARLLRGEIFLLEQRLSDIVNDAYGLTPDEVALMWRTAPPRMPFTPAGLQSADEGIDDDKDAEE
jgi:hypothetical protein